MKIENAYTREGLFKLDYIYNQTFGIVPSQFYYKLNTDDESNETTKFDIKNINLDLIKNKFPEAEMMTIICKYTEQKVSCASQSSKSEPQYGGAYVNNAYHSAEANVVVRNLNVMFNISAAAISLFYSSDSQSFEPEKFIDELLEILPLKKTLNDDEPEVSLVAYSNDGYYTINSEINPTVIDIEKNYNDDFKEVYQNIIDFIGGEERKSGLILLNGEPGTGKTYFIRHLITHFRNKHFILIPPGMAARLSGPDFIEFLVDNKDSVFIIEDCEQVIMDRKSNSFSSAVSAMLNMSDGLMSDIFNGKFICTFNADTDVIDDAIMRKGRCFGKYTFGKLSADKTKKLLEERGIKIEDVEEMTLANIYNYDINNIPQSTKKKIGF